MVAPPLGFGTPNMFLKSRLNYVKKAIRKWRLTESLQESKELANAKARIEELVQLDESRTLSESELLIKRGCKQKICELERFAKLDLQQKAKIRWVQDGDENTRFFHGTIKSKNRKNRIHGLNINGP